MVQLCSIFLRSAAGTPCRVLGRKPTGMREETTLRIAQEDAAERNAEQQRAADAAAKRAADTIELRNLVFDDGAGISLDMVQKLLRAANFLAIQPPIDAACSVIAMAINNTEGTQLQFIDAAP